MFSATSVKIDGYLQFSALPDLADMQVMLCFCVRQPIGQMAVELLMTVVEFDIVHINTGITQHTFYCDWARWASNFDLG